jgi:3-oxoacyl-[acyl-carrier-protein] synthase III
MTSIIEVASCIPDEAATIEEIGERFGISRVQVDLFTRFLGLREVRIAPDRGYADRLVDAASNLTTLRGNESRVKYVLAARTALDMATTAEDPLGDVVHRLGLSQAVAFSVTEHACASGMYALWIAGNLLRDEDPDALALILMGEMPSMDGFYLPGTSIMGDSSAACLVSAEGRRDRLASFAYHMNANFEHVLIEAISKATSYEDVFRAQTETSNDELGKTYIEEICRVMDRAASEAGTSLAELAMILPHNVNRISWIRICRAAGISIEKVMTDLIPVTGHCYTADCFLNYVEADRQGLLREGDHYMTVGVGTDGSFASMVFQR